MTTFKCKRSGNTVSFTNEDDVKHMRNHEGYEEVKEAIIIADVEKIEKPVKRRGRPPKQ